VFTPPAGIHGDDGGLGHAKLSPAKRQHA
jgi:hypothetical protein